MAGYGEWMRLWLLSLALVACSSSTTNVTNVYVAGDAGGGEDATLEASSPPPVDAGPGDAGVDAFVDWTGWTCPTRQMAAPYQECVPVDPGGPACAFTFACVFDGGFGPHWSADVEPSRSGRCGSTEIPFAGTVYACDSPCSRVISDDFGSCSATPSTPYAYDCHGNDAGGYQQDAGTCVAAGRWQGFGATGPRWCCSSP